VEDISFAEKAFKNDFPNDSLVHLKTAVNHGYILANKCIADNDFLKSAIGKRDWARLQNTAVEFAIKDRAERMNIELRIEEANNIRGSFPHYNFFLGNCVFTTSRTEYYDAFPRDAMFRSMNSALNSQIKMIQNSGILEVGVEQENTERYYGILTYGGRYDIEFIHFGIPNSEINNWLYQCNIAKSIVLADRTLAERENIAASTVAAVKDQFLKRQEVANGE